MSSINLPVSASNTKLLSNSVGDLCREQTKDFPPANGKIPDGYDIKYLVQILSALEGIGSNYTKVNIPMIDPSFYKKSLRNCIGQLLYVLDNKADLEKLKAIQTADDAKAWVAAIQDKRVKLCMSFIVSNAPELLDVPLEEILTPAIKKKYQPLFDRFRQQFPQAIVRNDQSLHQMMTSTFFLGVAQMDEEARHELLEAWIQWAEGQPIVVFELPIIHECSTLPYLVLNFPVKRLFEEVPFSLQPMVLKNIAQLLLDDVSYVTERLAEHRKEYEEVLEGSVQESKASLEKAPRPKNSVGPAKFDENKTRALVESTERGRSLKLIIKRITDFEKLADKYLAHFSIILNQLNESPSIVIQGFKRMLSKLSVPLSDIYNLFSAVGAQADAFGVETKTSSKSSKMIGDVDGSAIVGRRLLKEATKNVSGLKLIIDEITPLLASFHQTQIPENLSEQAYEQLLIELSEQKPAKKNSHQPREYQPLNQVEAQEQKTQTIRSLGLLTQTLGPKLQQLYTTLRAEMEVDTTVLEEITDHAYLAAQGIELFRHLATQKKDVAFPFHFFLIDLYVCMEQFLTAKILSQGKTPDICHSLVKLAKQSALTFTAEQTQLFKTFDKALLLARYPQEYQDLTLLPLFRKLNQNPTPEILTEAFQLMLNSFETCSALLLGKSDVPDTFKTCTFEKGHSPTLPNLKVPTKGPGATFSREAQIFYQLIQRATELRQDKELKSLDFYTLRGLLHTDKVFKHLCTALCHRNDLDSIPTHNLNQYFDLLKAASITPFSEKELELLQSINIGIAHHYHTTLNPPLIERNPVELEQNLHAVLDQLLPKLLKQF